MKVFLQPKICLIPKLEFTSLQIQSCTFLQAVRHSHMQMDTAHLFLLAQISFSSCRQTTSSPMLAWILLFASQASILSLFYLPGFPFRFTGKHSLAFPLAWTPLFPIRQAFSRFSACLDSSFSYQASISPLFRLPGFHFWLSGSRLYLE